MTHLRILFLSFMSIFCISHVSPMEQAHEPEEQAAAQDQVNNNVTLVVNGQEHIFTTEQAKKSETIKHLIDDENTNLTDKIPVPVTCTQEAWELIQKFMKEEEIDLATISQDVLADTINMVNYLDITEFFDKVCKAFLTTISFEEFAQTPDALHYFDKFKFPKVVDRHLALLNFPVISLVLSKTVEEVVKEENAGKREAALATYNFFKNDITLAYSLLLKEIGTCITSSGTKHLDLNNSILLNIFKTLPILFQIDLTKSTNVIFPDWYNPKLSQVISFDDMKLAFGIKQNPELAQFLILKKMYSDEELKKFFPTDGKNK